MYESFFGLHSKPFDLLPNPDFLYLSKSHKRALTFLDYGIKARAGFILITGEIGSGKTTIIRDLIKKKLDRVVLSKVFNTKVSSEQLISMINDDFGLSVHEKDKIALLQDLNEFLIDQYAKKIQPVLIIDEAQNLSAELLEEVRMLSNLETDQAKLIQIILVGQPELKHLLSTPELLQLRQRININCHIQPLSLEETGKYILHRLGKAGDENAARFAPEALELIHQHSRGIPRLVNIICDFFMLSMFSAESREMDGATAREILTELDFEHQFWDTLPTKPGRSADQDFHEASQDFERTKKKLTSLLLEITQRIDIIEQNIVSMSNRKLLDANEERINRLEEAVAEQSLQLDIFGGEITRLKSENHNSPPVEEPNDHQEPSTSPLDLDTNLPPKKGFFRRIFGGKGE